MIGKPKLYFILSRELKAGLFSFDIFGFSIKCNCTHNIISNMYTKEHILDRIKAYYKDRTCLPVTIILRNPCNQKERIAIQLEIVL